MTPLGTMTSRPTVISKGRDKRILIHYTFHAQSETSACCAINNIKELISNRLKYLNIDYLTKEECLSKKFVMISSVIFSCSEHMQENTSLLY